MFSGIEARLLVKSSIGIVAASDNEGGLCPGTKFVGEMFDQKKVCKRE